MSGSLIIVVFAAVCFPHVASQNLHWQERTPRGDVKPPARRYSALAWTPISLYLFGGEGEDGVLGDMWEFSLLTDEWTELNFVIKPSPRYGFVAGVIGNYWYISHGRDDSNVLSDTWVFDVDTEQWEQLNITEESVPKSRYFAAGGSNTVSFNDTLDDEGFLWISMGVDEVDRKLSDTWYLAINFSNPLQGEWNKLSDGVGLNQYDPTLPHARSQAAGIPFSDGKFIISGGCASGGQVGGPCPLEDSWLFKSSSSTWSKLPSCPEPAHSSSFVTLNRQLPDIGMLYGGTQKGPGIITQALSTSGLNNDELTLINITSLRWSKIKINNGSIPSQRSSPHLASGGHGVFLFGGESVDDGNFLNDLWLLEGAITDSEAIPCSYQWFSLLHLHGVIMYLAWGLLLPFGVMIGRYYRWSWPVWFFVHIFCQVFGTLLTVCGFIIVFLVSSEPSFPHGIIGIILMLTISQQFLSGIIRPWLRREDGRYVDDCKEKDTFKYKWRRCWEVYHRVSGVIAIALGFTQVTLGVFLINAPLAVWCVWIALFSIWLSVFLFHEIVHCCCVRLHKE